MTKARARAGRRRLRASDLQITPDRLLLPTAALRDVAIVLDWTVRAVVRAGADGLVWPMPHDLLGRLLDLVDPPSARSLIGGPIAFEPFRRVRWQGWRIERRAVTGRFVLEGPAAASMLPIPIELSAGGHCYGRGFAHADAGKYAFAVDLDRLPPGSEGVEIGPCLGTMLLAERLLVPAATWDHVGFVDPAEPWRVRGWVARRVEPRSPVAVSVWLDGHWAATAIADLPREDVAASGMGDGRSGFEIAFPPAQLLDRPVLVDVRVAPDGPSLGNSPYLQPAAPPYLGFFDGVEGGWASGWVIGVTDPAAPVRIEAVCDGAVIGAAWADLHRGDVAESGLPTARCGFHFPLAIPARQLLGRDIVARVGTDGPVLRGSPRQVTLNPNIVCFLQRSQRVPQAAIGRLRRRLTRRAAGLTVSIIMPVHDPRRDWLIAALESVRAQWSDNWELICVDDGSRLPHVKQVLAAYARAEPRIRVLRSPDNVGIARAVNFGLRLARGDYVAFLDHDDALEPDAVHHVTQAAQADAADLIYSDEALTGEDLDDIVDVRARPAFSHDFYLSHPYFVHLVCVRAELARSLGGYDEALTISADVDFVLRAIERAGAVTHIPRILYRWRTHDGSTGHARQDAVMAATGGAIARHLQRLGRDAAVQPGPGFNQFRVDWPDDGGEVLIVIPTRNRVELLQSCIASIERTAPGEAYRIVVIDHQSDDPATRRYLAGLRARHTVMPYRGPFNFARMNNAAVRRHGADAAYLLLLNNDVEAIEPGWLERMRSLAGRPEVGAVGALLLYDQDRVQHAGAIVGFGGAADHAMRFVDAYAPDGSRTPGHNCNLTSVRDYSAVTAACMMLRREVFERIGGFDERFAVGFNDTDLCLRLRQLGLKVLYDGQTVLYHHESATRIGHDELTHPDDDALLCALWAEYFAAGDPFYSPLLSTTGTDHLLRRDDGWRGQLHPRTSGRPVINQISTFEP